MVKFSMAMLVCEDVARSRDFYRDVFGLRVTIDSPEWVDLDLGGGARLGLHPTGEHLSVDPGSCQLGFTVEDVDAFVRDAQAKGATVYMEPFDEDFGRLALLGDPDGYTVQVYTPSTASGGYG